MGKNTQLVRKSDGIVVTDKDVVRLVAIRDGMYAALKKSDEESFREVVQWTTEQLADIECVVTDDSGKEIDRFPVERVPDQA